VLDPLRLVHFNSEKHKSQIEKTELWVGIWFIFPLSKQGITADHYSLSVSYMINCRVKS